MLTQLLQAGSNPVAVCNHDKQHASKPSTDGVNIIVLRVCMCCGHTWRCIREVDR